MSIVPGKEIPLVLIVAAIVTISASIVLSRKGKIKVQIRRLPALEVIKDIIARAAEEGRMIFNIDGHGLGGGDTDRGPQHTAAVQLGEYVAHQAALSSVRTQSYYAWPEFVAYASDKIRESLLLAGHPELFTEDTVNYTSGQSWGHAITVMGEIVKHDPAGVILVGAWSGEALLIAEAASFHDAITIGGAIAPGTVAMFVPVCSYNLYGGEIYAAEAVVSDDPTSKGSIFGQDLVNIGGLILIAISIAIVLIRGTKLG